MLSKAGISAVQYDESNRINYDFMGYRRSSLSKSLLYHKCFLSTRFSLTSRHPILIRSVLHILFLSSITASLLERANPFYIPALSLIISFLLRHPESPPFQIKEQQLQIVFPCSLKLTVSTDQPKALQPTVSKINPKQILTCKDISDPGTYPAKSQVTYPAWPLVIACEIIFL